MQNLIDKESSNFSMSLSASEVVLHVAAIFPVLLLFLADLR